MSSLSFLVDIRVNYGGHFEFKKGKTEFVIEKDHGGVHMLCGVWSDKITVPFLRDLGEKLVGNDQFELWFKRPGKTLTNGRSLVVSEYDVVQLIKGMDQMNVASLYITNPFGHVSSSSTFTGISPKTSTATVGFSVTATSNSPVEKKPNLRASKNLNPQFIEPLNEVSYRASFQKSWENSPTLTLNPDPKKTATKRALITHMRRYVMKRNFEKREGVTKYEDRHMPYANKYIKWATDQARFCKTFQAHATKFEVTCHGEGWGVNLEERTCDCRHWQLSGLPCVHVVACIVSKRLVVEDYVHDAYSKETYQLAYEPVICPMPSVKQWEKTGLPEPLPPPARKMPGRPSSKKRRKEAGEDKERRTVKRVKKMNKCGKCGQLGHYKRTCTNPPAPPKQPAQPGGRPLGTSSWSKQVRENAERRKATKAAYAAQFPPETATRSSQPSQSSVAQSSSTPPHQFNSVYAHFN